MEKILALVLKDCSGHFVWFRKEYQTVPDAKLVFGLEGDKSDMASLKDKVTAEAQKRGIPHVSGLY